jgi:hypothetical protein
MKNVPVLVKVISVFYYIAGVFLILSGLSILLLGSIIGFDISIFSLLGSIGGILMIALGVLIFYVARGLYFGKNWARIFVIVLASLAIISSIFSMIGGEVSNNIFSLIVNILIVCYLLSNKIKEIFISNSDNQVNVKE